LELRGRSLGVEEFGFLGARAGSVGNCRIARERAELENRRSRLGELFQALSHYELKFADVRGQEMAKRAIMIAAAAQHSILMLNTGLESSGLQCP
jgi:hypothetical protein